MDIKNRFNSCSPELKRSCIERLPQAERKGLVKILSGKQDKMSTSESADLIQKINQVQSLSLSLTKKSDRVSLFKRIYTKLNRFASEFLYCFGYLTISKTMNLVGKVKFNHISSARGVSQTQLLKIIQKERAISEGKELSLREILDKNNFPYEIYNCHFSKESVLERVKLDGVKFVNCNFDRFFPQVESFSNVKFESCSFKNTSFVKMSLDRCEFQTCNLRETAFIGTKLENSHFFEGELICCSFEDSKINQCTFLEVAMPATHFLGSEVIGSRIYKCNLNNCVFFGNLPRFFVDDESKASAKSLAPVTAMLVDPISRGITVPKAFMMLDQKAKTIPLRITIRSEMVTKDGVNQEVNKLLESIGPRGLEKPPIAQQLLKGIKSDPKSNVETSRILAKVTTLCSEVDAFLLPGGEDIPPSLYGEEVDKKTDWGGDYRRSILELGIIDRSFKQGIPIMGICRGFQMSNIYFGAHLVQHVKGHEEMQRYKLINKHRGLYAAAFKKTMCGASFHFQGVPATDRDSPIEASVIYKGLLKASEAKFSGSAPMILLQFHPEYYKVVTASSLQNEVVDFFMNIVVSQKNEVFWRILSDSAKAYRTKKVVRKSLLEVFSNHKFVGRLETINTKDKKIDSVIKKLYLEEKSLLEIMKIDPYSVRKYFKLSSDGKANIYSNERQIIRVAVNENKAIIDYLGEYKLEIIREIIREYDRKRDQL